MPTQGFLYRRLARFVPCVFPHIGEGALSLQSKYDVASARDVFMSAHYWRVFDHMTTAPRFVVDLGAHCGHFSVLCHLAVLEKFGADRANYLLVEALPQLIPPIRRVVNETGFASQVRIIQGLVGKRSGSAGFRTDARNLLSSQAVSSDKSRARRLAYRDLDELIPSKGTIDVLKIDIEGAEYDLLDNYPHILRAAKVLFVEVHGENPRQKTFEQSLLSLGLRPLSQSIIKERERLLCYGPKGMP